MSNPGSTQQTGLIAWFASNHVAANLMMFMIVAFGIVSAVTIRKQTTPDFEVNQVQIRVPYLGAAPQEVEEGVVIKVEEAIQDVNGITEINSRATEGMGTVTADIAIDEDLNQVLSDIKTQVDAISTFPALAEKPIIYKQDFKIPVLFISLYGDLDEFALKTLAQNVRDELVAIPSVNQVEILGDRDYEISIEVSEHVLREFGLTMSEVSEAVKNSSVDLPGGTINTAGGDILLRTEGQVYTGQEYAELVLRTYPDGTRLQLGDIATIRDGFVEDEGYARFNGKSTALLRILASGQQNELETSAAVEKYIEAKRDRLPDGVQMETWIERSRYLEGRLDLMTTNMFQGAILVFLVLTLFLRLKVAFWVVVGIPITFFGALWLMPHGPWPTTINMISLFGFILVLGIVVDDAIIIGESVYTKIRADGHTLDNVISGARKVATPATFGVLTTIAAFAPMLFVGGTLGPFFEALSVVVVLCLLFSLVESKLILPAHLVHARIKPVNEKALFDPSNKARGFAWISRAFQRGQRRIQHGLQWLIHKVYEPLLDRAIDNRGVVAVLFLTVLILTIGLTNSGLVRTVLLPDVPGDFIQLNMSMQNGTAPAVRNSALTHVEQALLDVNREYVANHPGVDDPVNHVAVFTGGDNQGFVFVEMPMDEDRPLNGNDIVEMWREKVGEIPGVKEMNFADANNVGGGSDLGFNLTSNDQDVLEAAAKELKQKLSTFQGVSDIRDTLNSGGQEIRLTIKSEAEALGLTMSSLGRQVRQAFYGEEAQRIQRGRDELKVMVRYPQDDRRSIADLENMRIRTPSGDEVPFSSVAEVSFGSAYSSIVRQNRKRTVTVMADIDGEGVSPAEVVKEITEEFVPALQAKYPTLDFSLEGASLEEINLLKNLTVASIAALFLIYALIAIPLKSYSQPLMIMSVIPFGLIGAVVGHMIMDEAISMFSLFGFIALAGVVVNDSLIMVDFINTAKAQGASDRDAVVGSGKQRFRAIVLTSLTTAVGLMPIMMEKSVQAQFVIPMAISLAFGILFATVITLFLVPCLYLLRGDFGRWLSRFWGLFFGPDEETVSNKA